MAGLKRILEYIDENIFNLKWKFKFGDVGIFSTFIKIDKEEYKLSIFSNLIKERKKIYLKICKQHNRLIRLFFGENEPMTYVFYRDYSDDAWEEWKILDRIFSKILFKHAKAYRFFLADKEVELYDKVTKFINELED